MIRQLSDERSLSKWFQPYYCVKLLDFIGLYNINRTELFSNDLSLKYSTVAFVKSLKQKYIIQSWALFLNLDLIRGLSWKTGVNLTKIEHEWKSRGPMRIWNKVRRKKTQEECTTKEFSKQLLKEREKVYISRKQKRNIFA